jgi:hypothetical protein
MTTISLITYPGMSLDMSLDDWIPGRILIGLVAEKSSCFWQT